MKILGHFGLFLIVFLSFLIPSFSQLSCPPNIDFEFGNLQNWSCFTSYNNGNYGPNSFIWSATSPISNRHAIVSGSATDLYGGFPIVAPGGGSYSLKLGNSNSGAQMEQVRYTFTVPANQNEYAVIYRYAIVLEDPGHSPHEQPFFQVRAYNATTGTTVNCGNFSYVSSSSLPGFTYFNRSGYKGYYKNWATASLNLSGQAGNTITLEFTTADCSLSGHFGYAYVDMNCGLFTIQNTACNSSATAPLSAPPGFQSYTWYDSTYSTILGNGQSITVPNPSQRTVFRVKLVPYPGYGCTDTLSTVVVPAVLTANAGNDTALCNQPSVQIAATATGNAPPFTYSWTSSTGFSCTNCQAPTVTPPSETQYFLTVTDNNNCTAKDTVVVKPTVTVTPTVSPVSCFGGSDGSISVNLQNGTPPLSYTWGNGQSSTTIGNLTAGNYTLSITDGRGCQTQPTLVVPEPAAPLVAAISALQNSACNGGANGSATATATGGTAPYAYSWNASPVQVGTTASNLAPGNYTVTVTDANGCLDTISTVISEPTALAVATSHTDVSCNGGTNGSASATVTGGTPPYSYSWNTTPVQTTAAATNLTFGNYTVTVTDAKGCVQTSPVFVTQPQPLTTTVTATDVACSGAATGSTTVAAAGGTVPYTYSWNTLPAQTTAAATNLISGNYTVTVTDAKGCIKTDAATVGEPTALVAALNKTDVSCHGGANGSAALTVAGGVMPYSYNWNTTPAQTTASASNLISGNYIVTVTDANGCSQTAVAAIAEPAALQATTAAVPLPCNGGATGSVSVTATGGTAPYAYNWNTTPAQTTATATGLTAGTYTATVTDAQGCVQTAAAAVVQPVALTISTTKTAVSCNGGANGTATVTASGGTAPYAYSWNTTPVQTTATASGLVSGNYTATVTDANGCSQTASVVVNQPAALAVALATTAVSCNGGADGTVAASVAGGVTPYTYSWNTTPVQTTATASNLSSGTYIVTVTDAKGCVKTGSAMVNQPPALTLATTQTDVACYDGATGTATVTASGGTAPYAYSWNTTPVQTTATVNNLISGNYTVTVTDSKNCSTTAQIVIAQPTALAAVISGTDISCNGGSDGTATVVASGGTMPYAYSWNTSPVQTTSTASGLISGNYTATVTDAKGCTQTQSITLAAPAALSAVATQTAVSCNGGANGTATVTASGGTAPYAYSWNTTPVQTTATASGLISGNYTATVTDAKGCVQTASAVITEPAALTAIATATNVSCNGGNDATATVTANGGTAPYAYSWNTTPVQTTAAATGLISGNYTVTVTDAKGCSQTASVNVAQPAALTASVVSSNVACNGGASGTATVAATGGTAPYSYNWNNGQTTATATGLVSGNYTVTVTDANGCSQTTSAVITEPSTLTASATGTNVSCNGGADGTATVTATGGTAPYSYSWNTTPIQTTATAGNLISGNYTVTVTDANGCSQTASANVSQPTPLTATATNTAVSCNGGTNGSATVTASGGTAPYSYNWNTTPVQTTATASNLISGNYTATVTDANGCIQTASVIITEPALLTATATHTNVSCNGGNSATATVAAAGGTAPYSYSWNTTPVQTTSTATGLISGNYTVTVTDANGCTQTAGVVVTEPAALTANATGTDVACNGGTDGTTIAVVTGGTVPYTYSWNTRPVQTTATATGLPFGTYTVTVTDANGCTETATAMVNQATTLLATASSTDVSCNGGANGTATVTASGGTTPYSYSWNTIPAQTTPAVNNLVSGNYTVTVTDANGCFQTASVVINQPTALSATAFNTAISCNGSADGTATVTATGGTAPYTYSWNTTPAQTTAAIAALTPGAYTATVTDANGCMQTASVTVTQPALLTAAVSGMDVACNGGATGSATVTAGGGTAPYIYSWNTTPVQTTATASNLISGNYTATVTDANGCIQTASVIITEPALLTATATHTNVSCNGGNNATATVAAAGGTAPYSYSWNTTPVQTTSTATGLISGNYTVTVTDANGCTQTASTTVTQPAALIATATGTNISCNGGADGTATVTATGGTAPYTYSWNTTPAQTTAGLTGLISGNYTATVTDANGCTQTASVTLTQASALVVSLSPTAPVCNGNANGSIAATTTGGTAPYSYSWNTTPIQTTATATGLISGNYTVTVTDANGCIQTQSASLSQPALLTAIATGSALLCNGTATGTVTVTASGGTAPYAYSWNTTPAQTTATVNNLISGNYTATVTDANGCTQTATATVTQPAPLTASATATNVSCNGGNTGTATVTAGGGTAPYTYSWSTTPVQTTATATGLISGNYTVTVTDATGCTQSTTANITQPTPLTITATGTPIACNGGTTGSVTAVVSGGTAPYTYSWNTTPVQTTATASNLGAGTYTVTVTDSKNCATAATAAITQPGTLLLSVAKTDPKCYGMTNGEAVATVTGGTAPYCYSWNNGQTTAAATGLTSGNYAVTITDAAGCTQSQSLTLSQPDSLALRMTSTNLKCYGDNNGTASAQVNGGTAPYTYIWNNNPALNTPNYSSFTAGTHTVIVTDVNGCTKAGAVTVTSPPALAAAFVVDSIPCFGAATGSLHLSNVSGGQAPYQYLWLDSSNATSTTRQHLRAGGYAVQITDAAGCVQVFSQVLPERPALNLNAGNDTFICGGSSVLLNTTGAAVRWQWSPAAGLSCTDCAAPVATPMQTTTYVLAIEDAFGCAGTDSVTLTVQPHQPVTVGEGSRICFGESATLMASGGDRYDWTPAASLQNPQTASPTATPDATTNYQVVIYQGTCFTDTLYQTVTVAPLPTVHAGNDVRLFSGGQITLDVTGSNDIKTYSWKPSVGLNCYDCRTPTVVDARSTTYIVTATTEHGCQSADTINIQVACDGSPFFVANTFKPNGDGLDDYFYPQGTGIVKINRMMVQSKWGEVVYERSNFPSNDPTYGWDGTFKGTRMDSGTFLYIIEAVCDSGEPLYLKGDINLIR